jgi:hypothetical protein
MFWVDQGYRFNQTGVGVDQLDDQTVAAAIPQAATNTNGDSYICVNRR